MRQLTRKVFQRMGSGGFPSLELSTKEKQEKGLFHYGGVERGDSDTI